SKAEVAVRRCRACKTHRLGRRTINGPAVAVEHRQRNRWRDIYAVPVPGVRHAAILARVVRVMPKLDNAGAEAKVEPSRSLQRLVVARHGEVDGGARDFEPERIAARLIGLEK